MTDEPTAPSDQTEAEQASRLARAKAAATERAALYADIANRRWPGFVMLGDLWRRYRRLNGTALAGNLAFRLFLWLLPASLLLVAALGFARVSGVNVSSEASHVGVGGSLGQAVSKAAEQAEGTRWHAGFIALLGLALASSGLLSALHYASVQLWELPPAPPARRVTRAAKLAGSLVLIVIVIGLLGAVRRSSLIVGLSAVALDAVMVAALLVGLFWILPRRSEGVIWQLPGALLGGLAWLFLQGYTTLYLPTHVSSLSTTYGTLGVAAAALSYLFILSLIIVVTTLVNVVWWDYHLARLRERGGEAPPLPPPPTDPQPSAG